ncbi:family 43 glycosylhydrolase [Asticcacaulis sp. AND118]|uniref:family 43 glycosylhydrolase n=1 Tax=Asticcacaulis sp. AND118 TaxID=2840468 RepID=UPI001D00016C|nr:family 43 glycosylhydrolase [Asticcacaulis sp. AND118]UDF05067.1 family 43 glycosylhydrolase [Asticcacaulis sp. AND118]
MKKVLCLALAALSFGGCAVMEKRATQAQGYAPKPLYRDPVYDGAADASIVYDTAAKDWKMFYTNRRATLKTPDGDVSWVHGTPIGVAASKDGVKWSYQGTANIPLSCTGETLWAPELYEDNGTYHMWLTVVPGVFKDWKAGRFIVHLTSSDLKTWNCGERLELGTDRAIDASVIRKDGVYRLWFKDERKGSRLFALESPDLISWVRQPDPVIDTNAEGPKVFQFGDHYWMIADVWKGLMVLRSDDLKTWTPQPNRILEQPGSQPTDNDKGQHPDVVVNDGRALIYYFVHQYKAPEAVADPKFGQRTVIQVAELKIGADGWLTVDRDAPTDARLKAPK